MKLLIIDDEKSIRNTLKDILEFEGHEVHLASDGVEGLAMATSDKKDNQADGANTALVATFINSSSSVACKTLNFAPDFTA